ncbi:ABC-type sugar transport system periplasmic component-like protein [Streptomyces xiamenensis]|uniref:ABC-type sugar transport system periplasmic component-like protein n=1 Tax=Streptomyces xiamenensis TaxID=408015 RepID=A0A0F7FTR4_9ACTN|nr:extracellular solute-binding protein [Streptomyces xiamenensis]AKG43113.1 ABC-type sugar transport system periplasmic component-like protein [Streptomyces xiamenensis]
MRAVSYAGGAVVLGLLLTGCGGSGGGAGDGSAHLTISANAVAGGKNAEEAAWIEEWVIPRFEEAQAANGVEVSVSFEPSGVDDEQYKTKTALDLQAGAGPDIITLDGIWVGEFAQAGYIEPLTAGQLEWDGWAQIPEAVRQLAGFEDELYGIPWGTDGRVLYYNKELFAEAGLPTTWQPTSWAEILDAGQALSDLDGVIPIQLNGGTAMGEATTMQGVLPLLAGAGAQIHEDGTWTGAGPALDQVLGLYEEVYGGGLGDPLLQQEAQGRDKSFQRFAEGRVGILAEGDYLWRGVLDPDSGTAPMAERDTAVGYAKIPAVTPGAGAGGQDFVSMSGGSVRVLNPAGEDPDLAFELLAFMNSAEALQAAMSGQDARITARTDVNETVLAGDPMLSFVAGEVLPYTFYRPPLAAYPQVSLLLQEATAEVISGGDPAAAAQTYQDALTGVVGGAEHVAGR